MSRRSVFIDFVFLPVLSGILLWLAWPPLPATALVFIGFVPLLIAEKRISDTYKKFTGLKAWLSLYLGLLIWNILCTWWVCNATFTGGLFANLANPILMSVPWMFSRKVRLRFGNIAGYTSLPFFWMAFEYIHLRWELTWPWLNLGNVFALNHVWVQWYSYTGTFGGTLWVWIANVGLFGILYKKFFPKESAERKPWRKGIPLLFWITVVALPIVLGYVMYARYVPEGKQVKVTVLQPNFDPWTEKFIIPFPKQVDDMIARSMAVVDSITDYLVWPETAIPDAGLRLNNLIHERSIRTIKKSTDAFPHLSTILGINGMLIYDDPADVTVSARKFSRQGVGDIWVDQFNTAIQIDTGDHIPFYNKSKLVPGAERMPYPGVFKFLSKYAIDLGGNTGMYGTQKDRGVFFNADSIGVGPVICYESVFGAFVSDYVKNGANLIFIITNDGWWKNTAGHKQHCMYASLRSIETRRDIARSANTGTSCFIDQKGDIHQATEWREDAIITQTILANNRETFYTRHGDYIGLFAVWMSIGILLTYYIRILMDTWNKRSKSPKV